ncbi:hypothetical protein IFR05_010720 [Cadophora sp. M221]|nr:hypothetical protein IFR05_010720 [Cadophora sp. M221]
MATLEQLFSYPNTAAKKPQPMFIRPTSPILTATKDPKITEDKSEKCFAQMLKQPEGSGRTSTKQKAEVVGRDQDSTTSMNSSSSVISGANSGPMVSTIAPAEGEPVQLGNLGIASTPTGQPQPSVATSNPSNPDAKEVETAPYQSVVPGDNVQPFRCAPPAKVTIFKAPQLSTKPIVVGIYGISGCGKSYLVRELKKKLGEEDFVFHDGSAIIDNIVQGGLESFKKLKPDEQSHFRILAIQKIRNECAENGKVGVVAGHYSFWEKEEDDQAKVVWTYGDRDTFTHMLYLNVPSNIVEEQRKGDTSRDRAAVSAAHLEKWQNREMGELRRVCSKHNIDFADLKFYHDDLSELTAALLRGFKEQPEMSNLCRATNALDEIMAKGNPKLETMLVLDGDRTLCAVDTGNMFWAELAKTDPLKGIFSGPLKYTLNAFLEASSSYDKATDSALYESTCKAVAAKVKLHPEFVKLLSMVEADSHVGAVVVSCGLRRVWEIVMEDAGFSQSVGVIGAGRVDNGYVVTAEVKAALVRRLQDKYGMHVWAFGDSPLDLPMLKEADEAIVVVGEKGSRSKTMDEALETAISVDGLLARQALLPSHVDPRLDTDQLRLFDMRSPEEMKSIFLRRTPLTVRHASTNAAKLLQTPMRNAETSGVALQAIHKKVGWFLATELITEVVGMEEHQIPHVQGGSAAGYRLLHEGRTTIVALMRGGEPMAKGVHEAFPQAMFVHANCPFDLKVHHLKRQETVLLVDSVINNGTTIVEFMKRIKVLEPGIRVVIVTGVAQKKSIAENGPLTRIGRDGMTVVALRVSDNKYTGKGGTDTGNRLFNTTHLD